MEHRTSSASAVSTCTLDEDSAFLIPQARREWLDGSRHHDGCGDVDDVDLHEQGFAKASKRRGRGDGAAALRLGVVQQALVEEMAASLREGWRQGEVECGSPPGREVAHGG